VHVRLYTAPANIAQTDAAVGPGHPKPIGLGIFHGRVQPPRLGPKEPNSLTARAADGRCHTGGDQQQEGYRERSAPQSTRLAPNVRATVHRISPVTVRPQPARLRAAPLTNAASSPGRFAKSNGPVARPPASSNAHGAGAVQRFPFFGFSSRFGAMLGNDALSQYPVRPHRPGGSSKMRGIERARSTPQRSVLIDGSLAVLWAGVPTAPTFRACRCCRTRQGLDRHVGVCQAILWNWPLVLMSSRKRWGTNHLT